MHRTMIKHTHTHSLSQGVSEGITQTTRRGGPNRDFVWNFPIEVNFRSTNPFGCKFCKLSLLLVPFRKSKYIHYVLVGTPNRIMVFYTSL